MKTICLILSLYDPILQLRHPEHYPNADPCARSKESWLMRDSSLETKGQPGRFKLCFSLSTSTLSSTRALAFCVSTRSGAGSISTSLSDISEYKADLIRRKSF